jgi:hypothetical protein
VGIYAARWPDQEKRGETLRYVCGHENGTAWRRLFVRRSASTKASLFTPLTSESQPESVASRLGIPGEIIGLSSLGLTLPEPFTRRVRIQSRQDAPAVEVFSPPQTLQHFADRPLNDNQDQRPHAAAPRSPSGNGNEARSEGMADVSDLDPVMIGEPLWTLRKDRHVGEARVRAIPEYGLGADSGRGRTKACKTF